MQLLLFKRYSFSSAHYLPGHPKCGVIHGHNYILEVGLRTESGDALFIDFAEVDLILKPLIKALDHTLLNDLIKYPSVENIAIYILNELRKTRLDVKLVRLFETLDGWVEVKVSD